MDLDGEAPLLSGPHGEKPQCGRFPRQVGFRTIRLNAVGWGALVSAGLLVALVVQIAGVAVQVAVPIGVCALSAAALVLDHRRWRRFRVGIGSSILGDPETAIALLARLTQIGITAEFEYTRTDGTLADCPRLRCRAPDATAVRRELEEFKDARP